MSAHSVPKQPDFKMAQGVQVEQKAMRQKRRVLLLSTQSLLGESLEHILSQVEDVELIGPWMIDEQVLARISATMPDVVLVAEEKGGYERGASLTTRILESFPDLSIVRIGLDQTVIRLYTSRTPLARSSDLLEIIRSSPAHTPQASESRTTLEKLE